MVGWWILRLTLYLLVAIFLLPRAISNKEETMKGFLQRCLATALLMVPAAILTVLCGWLDYRVEHTLSWPVMILAFIVMATGVACSELVAWNFFGYSLVKKMVTGNGDILGHRS